MAHIVTFSGQTTGTVATTSCTIPTRATYCTLMVTFRGSDSDATTLTSATLGTKSFKLDPDKMRQFTVFAATEAGYMYEADLPSGTVTATATRGTATNGMTISVSFFDDVEQVPPIVVRHGEGSGADPMETQLTMTSAGILVDGLHSPSGVFTVNKPRQIERSNEEVVGESTEGWSSTREVDKGPQYVSWVTSSSNRMTHVVFGLVAKKEVVKIQAGRIPKLVAAYLNAIPAGDGALNINPEFITSDEVVYEPAITTGSVDINSPTFITSDEVVYQPTVQPEQFVAPEFITSDETFYEPNISATANINSPTFITSEEVIYSPAVAPGAVDISSPTFITSEEVVYNPTVAQGLVINSPTFITTGEVIYQPAITVGPTFILPTFIDSEEVVYNPAIIGGDTTDIPKAFRYGWGSIGYYLNTFAGYNLTHNDAIHMWLSDSGSPNGVTDDRMHDYLGGKGYTGSLQDRWNQWRDDA